jgi:hypothetical protein
MNKQLWMFPSNVGSDRADLTGLTVEAIDGKVGKVGSVIEHEDGKYLLVDTSGIPLMGKTIVVPAGLVQGIDVDGEMIKVDRTTDELKAAPEYDESIANNESFRSAIERHYGAAA